MQDQIEELEYIKNNIGCSPKVSLLSNEVDENNPESSKFNRRTSYDDLYRQSFAYLTEAKRLANERRASLARTSTIDDSIHESDDDDENSLSFDQRSIESTDTANINDFNEVSFGYYQSTVFFLLCNKNSHFFL